MDLVLLIQRMYDPILNYQMHEVKYSCLLAFLINFLLYFFYVWKIQRLFQALTLQLGEMVQMISSHNLNLETTSHVLFFSHQISGTFQPKLIRVSHSLVRDFKILIALINESNFINYVRNKVMPYCQARYAMVYSHLCLQIQIWTRHLRHVQDSQISNFKTAF